MPIVPIDLREIDKHAANVYEAIIAVSKKARLMNDEQKLQYNQLVSNLVQANVDDDTEDFHNPDQAKISLEFEKKPKPHIQSLNLLLEGKLDFKYKQK